MDNTTDMLKPWKNRLNGDDFNVMKKYIVTFKEPWGPYDPLDIDLIKHCIKLNKSVNDLPDDDPYIEKYYKKNILY